MRTSVIVTLKNGKRFVYGKSFYIIWYDEMGGQIGIIIIKHDGCKEINRFKFNDIRRYSEIWENQD